MKKISSFILSAFLAVNICFTPVYASSSSDDDSDSILVQIAAPIVVPTVVVGGMILQSRQKKKQNQIEEYIDNLELLESDDYKTGGTETTEESPSTSLKYKDSYIKIANASTNATTILDAVKEAIPQKEGNS